MSASIILGKRDDGRIIHINDVEKRENRGFQCPGCGTPMVVVKTVARKKDWHFRHPPAMDIMSCRSKALHDLAVQILMENNCIILGRDWSINYTHPRKEVTLFSRRSDVTVSHAGTDIHFEVFVTHDCEEEKKGLYRQNKVRAVLIDLSDPQLRNADPDMVARKVLSENNNKQIIYWGDKLKSSATESNFSWSRLLGRLSVLLAVVLLLRKLIFPRRYR